jgi:transcriptional regulator with XRE-family HTH domain
MILNIGEKIRRRREQLGISVDELAGKLNKDRSTIYRYEKGEIGSIPGEVIVPIAKALETTPQFLLGWEDDSVLVDITRNSQHSSTVITNNPWMARNQEKWFDLTGGFEFSGDELELFYDVARFIMTTRDTKDYEDKLQLARLFFRQLNK